jgi:hypothetical protein
METSQKHLSAFDSPYGFNALAIGGSIPHQDVTPARVGGLQGR